MDRKGRPELGPAPDLVGRRFFAEAPDRIWVADITYVLTGEGWLHLAAVMDLHSRAVVGWAMAPHLRTELVIDALEMAIARRRPPAGSCITRTKGGLLLFLDPLTTSTRQPSRAT